MRYILTVLLISTSFGYLENLEAKIKSKPISALILFFADSRKVQFQFDGNMGQNITGIRDETQDSKPTLNCEMTAYFQEVSYLKSPHLKINFQAQCLNEKGTESIILSPEYVRLKDLKTESSGFWLSDTLKNVQFKIIDLKY